MVSFFFASIWLEFWYYFKWKCFEYLYIVTIFSVLVVLWKWVKKKFYLFFRLLFSFNFFSFNFVLIFLSWSRQIHTIQPLIVSWFRIHDTCGVNNLHGVPAILSALFSVFYVSLAHVDNYKDSLDVIFPAMQPRDSPYALANYNTTKIIGVRISNDNQ